MATSLGDLYHMLRIVEISRDYPSLKSITDLYTKQLEDVAKSLEKPAEEASKKGSK